MNTQSTHTPGPWYFNKSIDLERWLPCITRSDKEGQDNPAYRGEGLICAFDDELAPSAANARLIAGAPDLLAALIRAEMHLRFMGEAMDQNLAAAKVCAELADQARAAIARAEAPGEAGQAKGTP